MTGNYKSLCNPDDIPCPTGISPPGGITTTPRPGFEKERSVCWEGISCIKKCVVHTKQPTYMPFKKKN